MIQWFWFVPLALVCAVPWIVLVRLWWAISSVINALLPYAHVPLITPMGTGRQFRLRRRLWLSVPRLRRSCTRDTARVENDLRARLTHTTYRRGTSYEHPDGRIELDRSYYRQIGVDRALETAAEYGYALVPGTADLLPQWMILKAPNEARWWLRKKANPHFRLPAGYEWIADLTGYDRYPGRPAHVPAPGRPEEEA